jgi:hypothetical protein
MIIKKGVCVCERRSVSVSLSLSFFFFPVVLVFILSLEEAVCVREGTVTKETTFPFLS